MIGWYGCGKEAESGCELRVAGHWLRVALSQLQVSLRWLTIILMIDGRMKKSVAVNNIICY